MFLLETPRLWLRSFTDKDLQPFYEYRSDAEIARLQGWSEPYTYEMAQKFIDEMKSLTPGTPGEWYQVAIEEKSSGVLAGDIAFKILGSEHQQAEMGITLARNFHGLGYGLEAGRRLLAYLFEECSVHRVFANTDVLNTPAQDLLQKLGFRQEAHFVDNLWFKGRWSSEYWYGMLSHEWKDLKPEGFA